MQISFKIRSVVSFDEFHIRFPNSAGELENGDM